MKQDLVRTTGFINDMILLSTDQDRIKNIYSPVINKISLGDEFPGNIHNEADNYIL